MELNIDLLPQPKKKRFDLIIVIVILIGCLVGGSYVGTSTFLQLMNEQKQVRAELAALDQLKSGVLEKINLNSESITEENYLSYWQDFANLLEQHRLDSYSIITKIQHVLPIHSSVQSMSLEAGGKLSLEGSFSRMEDIAVFLDRVLQLPEVKDARVSKIYKMGKTGLEELDIGTVETDVAPEEAGEVIEENAEGNLVNGIEDPEQGSLGDHKNYLVEYILLVQRGGVEK